MKKSVLLVTDGLFHPPLAGRFALHRILRQMDGITFEHIRSLNRLPGNVENFSALVLHYHHKHISPSALTRLDGYVKNGGGILALHAATASFKDSAPYFDILGGRFTGHGRVEEFKITNQSRDIFADIPDFTVKDELYLHELNDRIQVHFTTGHNGKEIPVVWTYRYGEGKIFYAVPGHTSRVMGIPAFQEILQRGLKWVMQ